MHVWAETLILILRPTFVYFHISIPNILSCIFGMENNYYILQKKQKLGYGL